MEDCKAIGQQVGPGSVGSEPTSSWWTVGMLKEKKGGPSQLCILIYIYTYILCFAGFCATISSLANLVSSRIHFPRGIETSLAGASEVRQPAAWEPAGPERRRFGGASKEAEPKTHGVRTHPIRCFSLFFS